MVAYAYRKQEVKANLSPQTQCKKKNREKVRVGGERGERNQTEREREGKAGKEREP